MEREGLVRPVWMEKDQPGPLQRHGIILPELAGRPRLVRDDVAPIRPRPPAGRRIGNRCRQRGPGAHRVFCLLLVLQASRLRGSVVDGPTGSGRQAAGKGYLLLGGYLQAPISAIEVLRLLSKWEFEYLFGSSNRAAKVLRSIEDTFPTLVSGMCTCCLIDICKPAARETQPGLILPAATLGP